MQHSSIGGRTAATLFMAAFASLVLGSLPTMAQGPAGRHQGPATHATIDPVQARIRQLGLKPWKFDLRSHEVRAFEARYREIERAHVGTNMPPRGPVRAAPGEPAERDATGLAANVLKGGAAPLSAVHPPDRGGKGTELEQDWIRAHEQWVKLRAFPHNAIDWSLYPRAISQRNVMPAARLGSPLAPGSKASSLPPWQYVGPNNRDGGFQNGRINCVAYDPTNTNNLYCAAPDGGIWKSTDAGATWKPVSDFTPNIAFSSVAVDPQKPNIVYAGSGDFDSGLGASFGLRQSTDHGNAWHTIVNFGTVPIKWIAIGPQHASKVFCAAGQGLFMSPDTGVTWYLVAQSLTGFFSKISFSSDGDLIYAAADYDTVYQSLDGGVSFAAVKGAPATTVAWIDVCSSLSNDDVIYTLEGHTAPTSPGSVSMGTYNPQAGTWTWKSLPFATPWEKQNIVNYWSQDQYDFSINASFSGVSDVLWVGLLDLWQSPDAGAHWVSAGGYLSNLVNIHVDIHCIVTNPSNPSEVLVGCDGGVYAVDYGGAAIPATWPASGVVGTYSGTALNATLGVAEFYSAAFSPSNPQVMLGGTQDTGVAIAGGDLSNWFTAEVGDGAGTGIDQNNPAIQFGIGDAPPASGYTAAYFWAHTTDGWNTSVGDHFPIGDDSVPFSLLAGENIKQPNLFYFQTNYLYQVNAENNWAVNKLRQRFSPIPGNFIYGFASSPRSAHVLFTGTTDGLVWYTSDSGKTWHEIDRQGAIGGLPIASVLGIAASTINTNGVFVVLGGGGVPNVWRCDDVTAVIPQWIDVSGTGGSSPVPQITLTSISIVPHTGDKQIFVGGDIGVFYTKNSGATWSNATAPLGLPNVQVNGLQYDEGTGYLMCATYGRGMWRMHFGAPVLTSFTIAPSTTVGGSAVTGTLTLTNDVSGSPLTVNVSSDSGAATPPATVTIPVGQRTTSFTIGTGAVTSITTANVTASYNGVSIPAQVTVTPFTLASLTLDPTTIVGGPSANVVGTVTLYGPAPPAGVTVNLSSDNAAAAVPATVNVAGNTTTATFTLTTSSVAAATTANISASFNGTKLTAPLTVNPVSLSSLSITPNPTFAGLTATGTVLLNGPAGPKGVVVTLSSANTGIASVPSSITITSGQKSGTFPLLAQEVPVVYSVVIRATAGLQTLTATEIVFPPELIRFTATPNPVIGGQQITFTAALNAPAEAPADVIMLTSDSPVITLPSSLSVFPGQTTASMTVTTAPVAAPTTVHITAADPNGIKFFITVTVNP